jgi:hypothetical protein
MPEESGLLWSLSWQALLACWVHFDRRSRLFKPPFEFDAFVFFAWPFVLPYYLYKTRGARGLLFFATIFALFLVPNIAVIVVHILN